MVIWSRLGGQRWPEKKGVVILRFHLKTLGGLNLEGEKIINYLTNM